MAATETPRNRFEPTDELLDVIAHASCPDPRRRT
jgi:hypothetical protein